MDKVFKNDTQVTNFFTSEMKKVLDIVAEKMILKLQEKIDEKVYNSFTPTTYNRQMDNGGLRDLWRANPSRRKGDKVSVKVKEEPEFLTHTPEEFIHGSNHSKKGDDIRKVLAEFVLEGESGDLFGDGVWRDKRDFWTPFIDMLDDGEINTIIEDAFTAVGINFIRIS